MDEGILYICPTPIGNLDDITIRTLNTLKEVDLIAAEDTRHTIKLLNHFDISTSLTSYHEHNVKAKGPELVNKLLEGTNIALVSDAGMPGISDPGEDLVKLCIKDDIKVEVLPGATASIIALILSGMPTDKFVFEGFLPSKKKDRLKRLDLLKTEERTIILYEAPHRLISLLTDIDEIFKDREIAVLRELTKKYQEVFRGTSKEGIDKFTKQGTKGEFVVVLKGMSKDKLRKLEEDMWKDMTIKEHIKLYMENGFSKKQATKKVSKERKIPKREVYKESIDI
ncbi:MAG: 16S rRNA (cytidine(1402)-2'-O)-methyltransferase [Firmicutes bacterium]|nr:16S rRNA (cytidine(1402)-2'-O)-methyltransferase [Bacillota bacterium]